MVGALGSAAGASEPETPLDRLETALDRIEQMQLGSGGEKHLSELQELVGNTLDLAERELLADGTASELSECAKSRAVGLLVRSYEIAGLGSDSTAETLDLQRRFLEQAWTFLGGLGRADGDTAVTILRLLAVTSELQDERAAAVQYLRKAIEIQELAQIRAWSELETTWASLAQIQRKLGNEAEAARAEARAELLRRLLDDAEKSWH